MSTTIHLDKDENGKSVDQKLYRSMIRSKLYLTANRPDIMMSVCLCARFQADPKESHIRVVKRILRYLNQTKDFGLFYPKECPFELVSYSDADFGGSRTDRKSTSGTYHFIGRSLVSRFSKKQNCVSLSTCEAEYISTALACAQVIYMQQTLQDFGFNLTKSTIFCDNLSAINLSKNPINHSRTKHIDIRHHFLRDSIEKDIINLDFVSFENQLADIFTKPLNENAFIN